MCETSVFGVFNQYINIASESTEKPSIYDLLLPIPIYSPKKTINIPLK